MSVEVQAVEEGAEASLRRAMLVYLAPLVIGSILFVLSGTVSNVFIGALTGVSGFAAASTFIPFGLFLLAFAMSLSSAASILVGQAFGTQEAGRMQAVAGTALTASLALSLVIGVVGYASIDRILVAFGTKPEILADAAAFARANFVLLPIMFVLHLYFALVRGIGDTTSPFFALLVGTVLTFVLTPALIEGYAGLPRLGVAGSAYAAGLCQLAMLVVIFAFQRRTRSPIAVGAVLSSLRVDFGILKILLGIGIWIAVRMLIAALSEMTVLYFVNGFGSKATAAYGAANQIFIYLQILAFNFLTLSTFFASKEIGAGRVERIPVVCRTALWLCVAAFGLFIAVLYVFARPILGWFVQDPATMEIAHRFLMITLWSFLAFGPSVVFVGVTGSDGTKVPQTLISGVVVFGIMLPTVYVMSRQLGLDGVWLGYPAAFIAGLLFQGAYLALVWLKSPHEKLV
jgi:putative MATE family efflux protein